MVRSAYPIQSGEHRSQKRRKLVTNNRNHPRPAHVFGVDIGKNIFHVVGVDQAGTPIQKVKFKRETLLQFFERAEPTIIGMEACPGCQWLARKLIDLGHDVRIIPAQYVKPYVKTNKNDIIDAEAIAEAATRPTMRFVQIKSEDQSDSQALHRVRERLIAQRTRLVCQMRAFCLEYGVAIRQGIGVFKADLPSAVSNQQNDLTPAMRRLLTDLYQDFERLNERIKTVTNQIEAACAKDEVAKRLMTIPGIGPLGASAIIAAVGDGRQFKKARDMSAWLGLVPKQHSTGGKQTLLGISKRGNAYIRKLLIHGARSCVLHLNRERDRLGAWLDRLEARMHRNKVAVALANKLARVAWVILNRPGALYTRHDPRFL